MVTYSAAGVLLALVTALPLAWKWQLGIRRTSIAVAMLGAAAMLVTLALAAVVAIGPLVGTALVWILTTGAGAALALYRFFRDPERKPPVGEDVIVSPADGQVVYVREAIEGALPVSTKRRRDYRLEELTKTSLGYEDAVVVGISLSFLDVHVTRSPVRGKVVVHRAFPGRFASLRRPEAVFENTRTTTVIRKDRLDVAVVQIASRLVRRIVSRVREGDAVDLGDRIGVIRFGSQVDVVLPARQVNLVVEVGDRMRAGETTIATLNHVASHRHVDETGIATGGLSDA